MVKVLTKKENKGLRKDKILDLGILVSFLIIVLMFLHISNSTVEVLLVFVLVFLLVVFSELSLLNRESKITNLLLKKILLKERGK